MQAVILNKALSLVVVITAVGARALRQAMVFFRHPGDRTAIARQERQRRAYTPEEIRTRLHERYAESND